MNTPSDNDFTQLRRLLSLKRHEQPPPGYFNNFSRNVIASLREEQRVRAKADGFDEVPRWILRFVERLQARPALAGLVGAGLCALVIGSILSYEKDTQRPVSMPSLMSEITPAAQPEPVAVPTPAGILPVPADAPRTLIASNNLPSSSTPSLFDSIDSMSRLQTEPVGFQQ